MLITDEYLEFQDKYIKIYGENTIVLMQVGSFFECYAVDNEKEQSNNTRLQHIADILNIQKTKKDKKKQEINRSNPLMLGFPIWSLDKFTQILINNFYTIILVEQTTEPPNCKRDVTKIISPGTTLTTNNNSSSNNSNNLMCIYIDIVVNAQKYKKQMYIGNSVIDVSTGKNTIYETYSIKNNDDYTYPLDETYRFIQTYDPSEIIIVVNNKTETDCLKKDYLIQYLELSNKMVHYFDTPNKDYLSINFQSKLLEKLFKNNTSLSIIEYLDLERLVIGTISYTYLLNFAFEHNEQIVMKLNKPEIWNSSKYLILTNNSINQLNIINNNNNNNKIQYNSLYSILNKTSTRLGARYLRDRLLNPILDSNEILKRYEYLDSIYYNEIYKKLEVYLNKIIDLERVHRRLSLGLLQPSDFFSLNYSYVNVLEIIENISFHKELYPSKKTLEEFKSFINDYNTTFDMDVIVKYNIDNIKESIFIRNVNSEIDNCDRTINKNKKIINEICNFFSKLCDDNSSNLSLFKCDYTEKEGYHIYGTKNRCNILKKKLCNFNPKNNMIYELAPKDITFKQGTANKMLITSNYIKKITSELHKNEVLIGVLCKELFKSKLEEFTQKYSDVLLNISHFIGIIDLYKSIAKASHMYGYTKPEIDTKNTKNYIDCKDIRHPIIERIQKSEYITNDIYIGDNNETKLNGMLLYGTNASGKSSLMKAVGLNLIMAQCGFYTATSKFVYTPYEYIFTRILNNDNIFKGESSFAVEMGELRSILKRSNSKSLVLGDELCSGTESISAQSIFAASVIKLDEKNVSFIFATHLHQLMEMEEINRIKNVKAYHLKVIYNKTRDILCYNRKLEEGNGPTTYGLEVCKAMDLDSDFIKIADKIRRKIMKVSENILENRKSKYNSKIIMDKCEICENNLAEDTHHIKFQCSANKDSIIDGYIYKNIGSNLVPLCKNCHVEVHRGKIIINGYIDTTKGIILDYYYDNNPKEHTIKKKKYDELQIDIIKNIKNNNITKTKAIKLLEIKHGIKISNTTLTKIWDNKY